MHAVSRLLPYGFSTFLRSIAGLICIAFISLIGARTLDVFSDTGLQALVPGAINLALLPAVIGLSLAHAMRVLPRRPLRSGF